MLALSFAGRQRSFARPWRAASRDFPGSELNSRRGRRRLLPDKIRLLILLLVPSAGNREGPHKQSALHTGRPDGPRHWNRWTMSRALPQPTSFEKDRLALSLARSR